MPNTDLIGTQAAHAGFVNRVAKGNADKVVKYLLEAVAYIESILAAEGETIRNQKRLNAMLVLITARLSSIYGHWERARDADLELMASYEGKYQIGSLEDFTVGADFTLPSDSQLIQAAYSAPIAVGRAGGAVALELLLDSWKPQQIQVTNGVITHGFSIGQTTEQISRRIRNEVLPLTRRDSNAIVITATNHISTTAKAEVYKENSDIVIGYRLIATLDDRTSDECRAWDQTVILNDADYQPKPPFHYQCRTTTVPELSEEFAKFDKGATRAANGDKGGGKTSSTQQYYDWLKSQSAIFQDDALGKERGLIFRNSGLTPQEFKKASVDQLGKPLTIKEMAERDERIKKYLQ